MSRLPGEYLNRFFLPDSGGFRLTPEIRARIRYLRHDLLTLCEPGAGFSAVVCKNVLLHFQAAERVEVIRMFHRALAPGGYLALEQTQDIPGEIAPLFTQVTADARVFRMNEI